MPERKRMIGRSKDARGEREIERRTDSKRFFLKGRTLHSNPMFKCFEYRLNALTS